jgi:Ferritin-like domain
VDLASAEPETSRRSMFGAVGAAGLAAAVGALAFARPAAAAPFAPTAADKAVLRVLMQLELAARDLYQAAAAAGLDGAAGEVAATCADNHQAYGQSIAGAAGLSADSRVDAVFEQFEPAFTSGDVAEWATAAHELEATFVATHADATALFEAVESINLITSILVVEGRMAMVLADLGDFFDLDAVLSATEAEALDIDTLMEAGA